MKRVVVTVTLILLALAPPASATRVKSSRHHPPLPMWQVFVPGYSWAMRSSVNGHVTHFRLHRLSRWGCWKGDIIDLVDIKQAPEDYWGPGGNVIGHQIELRDVDGSWRMVGTYTTSPDPTQRWTMQVHGYPGRPTPYVIVPGRRVDSDTQTAYYLLFARAVVSSCLTGGPTAAPSWGQNVYWRSRFTFAHGALMAHYEENRECGQVACQVENWRFATNHTGISRIADVRGGGNRLSLVLNRMQPRRRWLTQGAWWWHPSRYSYPIATQ